MASQRPRVYLAKPHMSGYEQEYIESAFATNWIAPLGPNVDEFEKEISQYTGIQGALALSSGSAAIHLGLKLLGVGKGDRVFCSSLTFIATANPIIYEGGEPIYIDSEPESWNMSPQALEKAFHAAQKEGKLPKAGIIVDLYGQSADMQPLLEIFDSYNVPVLEDAAEAFGATYRGQACGKLAKLSVLSFNGNKIITTSGGGMLLGDDLEAIKKARFWATQARDNARHYEHSEIGYNYRLSNVLAGIGRGQLKVLEDRVKSKRQIFDYYYQALKDIDGITFMPEASFGKCNRWLTTLTLDPKKIKVTPNQIIDRLEEENIEARPVWKPLHNQPIFNNCQYYTHEEGKSISDYLFENGICLPSGTNMALEDQDRVIQTILSTLK